ncbi:hypothetical protein [Dokdonia sp.]|uniref:hypothetical protein n=1 Tax=Dokdonia sp. TaxID=2024995 RepID=UPI00326333A7
MDKVNFKKWAFHFMIWIIIINIITVYLLTTSASLFNTNHNTGEVVLRLGLVATLLLVLSLLFIILSLVKKEKRNYQFWIAAIGILLFGGFPLLMSVFGY